MEQAVDYAHAHESEYDTIWMSNDNQTYIYVLFFTHWPPSDVHRRLAVRRILRNSTRSMKSGNTGSERHRTLRLESLRSCTPSGVPTGAQRTRFAAAAA
jgi:hypothetical protein